MLVIHVTVLAGGLLKNAGQSRFGIEMVSLDLNFRSLTRPSIDIFVLCSLGGGFH